VIRPLKSFNSQQNIPTHPAQDLEGVGRSKRGNTAFRGWSENFGIPKTGQNILIHSLSTSWWIRDVVNESRVCDNSTIIKIHCSNN
jgi:hypothetical protein